jgi:hypothetical protein
MPLPFDATLKDLAEVNPRGLLSAFATASPTVPVVLLNVDLSTVTTAADVVFGLGDPLQEIVHLDFQASASATKHADVLVYNALLYRKYLVPVHSIVILLRSKAAHPKLNGMVAYAARPPRGKMDFGYEVVRLWERPVEDLLAMDVAMLPLAPLGQLPKGSKLAALAGIIKKIIQRLQDEAPPEQVRRLLTAAFVLTGLRVPRQTAVQLFQGVRAMRESDTFMAIVEEGELKEAKKIVLLLGKKSLGAPDESVKTALESITNLERLELMLQRIGEVETWQQLLAKPKKASRR